MKHLLTFKISLFRRTVYVFSAMLLLFFSGTETAQATHAVGTDLTYTCLGGNDYEITLTLYRDCDGVAAPNAPDVSISSASCGQSTTLTLSQAGVPQEVSPICPANLPQTTCNGGSLQGVQQYTYSATYTFPQECTDWTLSYNLCCRNGAITNSVVNSNSTSLYIESIVDNTNSICNNSPVFTTPPVPYVCIGQPFSYNHGATDAEGDLLVYTLVNPLDDLGVNVPYQPGFSPVYPISTTTGSVTFDTQTGQLDFTPNAIQVGITSILVEEYRNGQLIGSVIRDMQVVVINCNNTVPGGGVTPSNVSGGTLTGNTFNITPGTALSFDLVVSDPDVGSVLTVTDNVGIAIPGASLTTSGTNPVTISFNWTPTATDVGNYSFAVTIEDDACPVPGSQTLGYNIIVTTPVPTLGQWGLILLTLLFLNIGVLSILQSSYQVAGVSRTYFSSINIGITRVLVDRKAFLQHYLIAALFIVLLFAISIFFFNYELMPFDVPGSVLAAGLLAFFVRVLELRKE